MDESLTRELIEKTSLAEQRLAALTDRVSRAGKVDAGLPASSLQELRNALDELQTATEQLICAADAVALLRREATRDADRYRDLYEQLPVPCVLTTSDGLIENANRLASKLLNVGSPHFKRKPLFLYLPQRDTFFDLLQQVQKPGGGRARMSLRPRDRKPLAVDVTVTSMRGELCWVLTEVMPPRGNEPARRTDASARPEPERVG
jgi:PAS domain-containing protein